MSTKTTTIVTRTCDICGKEGKIVDSLHLLAGFAGEVRNEIRMEPRAHLPYATSDGDVCEACLVRVLREFVANWEWRNPEVSA